MKKFILYTIIFLSLFVGTATCVIANGYSNYIEQENNSTTAITEDSPLTSLASSVLNSENYSGNISISDSENSTDLNGTFSYINNGELSFQLTLSGSIYNTKIETDVRYIEEQIFIEFNNKKFMLTTNDLLSALNGVISSINTTADSSLPTIDMNYAQSLLSNITTSQLGNGYLIQAKLPNICDIYITADNNYIPSQILVTNLSIDNKQFTINIKGYQTLVQIEKPVKNEFLNINPVLSYISPAINTITQGNLCVAGTVDINGTAIQTKAYYINNNLIIGEFSYNNLCAQFQIKDGFLYIKLYNNVFKLTFQDITELINKYIPKTFTTEPTTSNDILNKLNIIPTIENDKFTKIDATYDNLSLSLEIGKTIYIPEEISSANYLNKNDIIALIDGFKNIISNEYSLDLALNYNNIDIFGNAYLKINDQFSSIKSLYFSGKILNIDTTIIYGETESYIKIQNNKIKLQNTSLTKIIEILSAEISNINGSTITLPTTIDVSILNNLHINGRTITYEDQNISAKIISYVNSYKLTASMKNAQLTATIYPSDNCYARIIKNINTAEYKSFDNTPDLLSALLNTINKNELNISGNIDIKILDMTYKNISVDIKTNKSTGKIVIKLDNLPTDSILTYLSNTYYKNQKSVITIQNNKVSIYTTVILRATNKTVCIANKTVELSEFGLDNLYDILSVRKPIINKLKGNSSGGSGHFTNLTTDCLDIYKNYATIDLSQIMPNENINLNVQFNYTNEIKTAMLLCNINDLITFKINLDLY